MSNLCHDDVIVVRAATGTMDTAGLMQGLHWASTYPQPGCCLQRVVAATRACAPCWDRASHVMVVHARLGLASTWPASHAALAGHVVPSRALLWALPRTACHTTSSRWPALQSSPPADWPCSAGQCGSGQSCRRSAVPPLERPAPQCPPLGSTLQSPPPHCEPSRTSQCPCGAPQPETGWRALLWAFPGISLPLVSRVSRLTCRQPLNGGTAQHPQLQDKVRRRVDPEDELTHPLLGDAPTLQLLPPRDQVTGGQCPAVVAVCGNVEQLIAGSASKHAYPLTPGPCRVLCMRHP